VRQKNSNAKTELSKLIFNAIKLADGFACNLRPRKARCLPTRVEISHLGNTIFTGYVLSIANADRELREQLDRASLSALLNTAEGNGRRQGRQRATSTRTNESRLEYSHELENQNKP
jgi:hypothetical protein